MLTSILNERQRNYSVLFEKTVVNCRKNKSSLCGVKGITKIDNCHIHYPAICKPDTTGCCVVVRQMKIAVMLKRLFYSNFQIG